MSLGSAFLLIWIIIQFPFSKSCLQDERNYLLDFKAGLNLSSARLSSWRGFNCCEWEGVACEYHTSHVIRLDVSTDQGLDTYDAFTLTEDSSSRELRPSLFNLQHLQHLDLSGINFQGISIPSQLSKLQKLTFLSLSNAGFGGEVPLEMGNMSSLRHLHMSCSNTLNSNKFDVWVRNLRSLEFLVMTRVNLTMASEHWGGALSGLPNLTKIYLYDCELSGNIPDLSNLTRLSHLHIGSNYFPFELSSWFANASSLVSLDLSNCYLYDSIPSNFLARSRMSYLVLDTNFELKGNLSFILGHSSSLVVLSLSECNLGGAFPQSIANFSKLKAINLRYNNLEGSIPSSFSNFLSLESIDLSHNNFEGSIPSSFGNFSSLKYLHISHNRLSGHIPPSLCQLPTLREFVLDHNQLSGTIPDSISNLEVLSLSSNELTGKLSLQLLENLTRLREFHLSENQLLINISPSLVPQFAHLEGLGLGSCNIEGDLPAFLSQQYQLERLDLSDNNIVGNLPSWLWDLPYLQYLNLSNNQLEGCLPQKISNGFHVVDLHSNRLYGSLPALDFASEILDLSDNGFNGSIPAKIDIPVSVSLSGNNLTGQIPSSICFLRYSTGNYGALDLSKNKLIVVPDAKSSDFRFTWKSINRKYSSRC
ncbi:hypothetical protein SUGI_0875600 [Cryptomeria japonica]|nr:hypothetical protein SUGI_0875600 [Cryptomeria japonica]